MSLYGLKRASRVWNKFVGIETSCDKKASTIVRFKERYIDENTSSCNTGPQKRIPKTPETPKTDSSIRACSAVDGGSNDKSNISTIRENRANSQPQCCMETTKDRFPHQNPENHQRTKHIDVQYHFTRARDESNEIAVEYIPTADMTIDILTKSLEWVKHERHMRRMGLVNQ
jgi:hypothetical protein